MTLREGYSQRVLVLVLVIDCSEVEKRVEL